VVSLGSVWVMERMRGGQGRFEEETGSVHCHTILDIPYLLDSYDLYTQANQKKTKAATVSNIHRGERSQ
jgi:hypothetical protein